MKAARTLLGMLEKQRRDTADEIGSRPIGVAACEVLDELIRRTRVLADAMPANAPITLAVIDESFPKLAETLTLVSTTMARMADVEREGGEAVEMRRQPFLRFIERVRADGYAVGDDCSVTDAFGWAAIDDGNVASVEVQHAAEKIARAEQAVIYQQRIERMMNGLAETEHHYAQRIRDLIDRADG